MSVIFETAMQLRDAGFPQPEMQPHQFWYVYYPGQNAWHFMCGETAYREYSRIRQTSGLVDAVYCPIVTELMPDGWYLAKDMGEFVVTQNPCSYYGERFANSNPAEAAAMAWLYANKKTTP